MTLGDLGLHCTAWNQATSPTSPTSPQGAWAQKPLEVMSTAPMGMAPMEKRAPPVFLPPGAFSSPMAGGKHLGDASSRMVTGTSPNMQLPHPDQDRLGLKPGWLRHQRRRVQRPPHGRSKPVLPHTCQHTRSNVMARFTSGGEVGSMAGTCGSRCTTDGPLGPCCRCSSCLLRKHGSANR